MPNEDSDEVVKRQCRTQEAELQVLEYGLSSRHDRELHDATLVPEVLLLLLFPRSKPFRPLPPSTSLFRTCPRLQDNRTTRVQGTNITTQQLTSYQSRKQEPNAQTQKPNQKETLNRSV